MKPSLYEAQPSRVVFGTGALLQLPAQVQRLDVAHALLLCSPGRAESATHVAALLGERAAGVFAQAARQASDALVDTACDEATRLRADGLVTLGGGSTTALAKAVALRLGMPIVAIATTYGGSEMTPAHDGHEAVSTHGALAARTLPRCVVYDPALTLTLPAALTVSSAFNAIAHAAEGLYAPDANPVTSLLAEDAIRAFALALPRLRFDPRNLEARSDALYGAWLCGTVYGATTMGLHHALCELLCRDFALAHADVHAVMLPHTLAHNGPAAPEAMLRIARAFGSDADDVPRALHALARHHGAPTSLSALGMPSDGLSRVADVASSGASDHPRPVGYVALRDLLQRAFDGDSPEA